MGQESARNPKSPKCKQAHMGCSGSKKSSAKTNTGIPEPKEQVPGDSGEKQDEAATKAQAIVTGKNNPAVENAKAAPVVKPDAYSEPAAEPAAAVAALAMAKPSEKPPHFGPEALLESVASGAIAPLRGSWLVELESQGGRLSRRQDLPAEAFFGIEELRRVVEALGEDYGLLFVALSYRWLSKDHPDPDGFHLHIVAAVARLYMHRESGKSPLTAAFEQKGLGYPDFALFCAPLTPGVDARALTPIPVALAFSLWHVRMRLM